MHCASCKDKPCCTGQNCPGLETPAIEAAYDADDRRLLTAEALRYFFFRL